MYTISIPSFFTCAKSIFPCQPLTSMPSYKVGLDGPNAYTGPINIYIDAVSIIVKHTPIFINFTFIFSPTFFIYFMRKLII